MAQHDYVIDNSTGANVRADINSALQAIASNNSGSSDPSTTYAFQLFADTTNNVMKIRNAANNAFIELFQLDGTFTLEDGSVSTPALAFRDDLNTGIFSSAADTFNVATGGVERMELGATTIFNEDGADVDFRIEGDTQANLFYVDAGNDRVGIGTSSPRRHFHIHESASSTVGLMLTNGATGESNDSQGFQFKVGNDGTAVIDQRENQPITFSTNGSERMRIDSSGRLLIGTTTGDPYGNRQLTVNIISSNGDNERLRIDSSGNVGIGTTSPSHLLEVNGNISLGNGGSSGGAEMLRIHNDSGVERIHATNNPSALAFGIGGTGSSHERMRIDTSGRLLIGTTSANSVNAKLAIAAGTTPSYYSNPAGLSVTTPNDADANCVEFFQGRYNKRVLTMSHSFNGNVDLAVFEQNDVTVGSITGNGSNASFNTSSDYRLKENIVTLTDGITRLKQLTPRRFNWIADSTNTLIDGFIAHEVSPVIPEAVTGEKDAIEEDGSIDPQQMDYSKLVPLLVAAVQELIGKVEALEAA